MVPAGLKCDTDHDAASAENRGVVMELSRPEVSELLRVAEQFAASDGPALLTAEVARDRQTWEAAHRDPEAFLRERGIKVPKGLQMKPIPWPGLSKPTPEWMPFTIRLTDCRQIVFFAEGEGWKVEEVCFGWEITPNPIPGGPIG